LADPRAFLERWSRLKRHAISEKPAAAPAEAVPSPVSALPTSPARPEEDPLKDLPPLDTLGRDSDYRAFMRPGVPEELRSQALRKLWGSDPVYANLDGLLEYGENFAEPFEAIGTVATLYRVLEGMPQPEPAPEVPSQSPAAATQTAAAAKPDGTKDGTIGSKVGLGEADVINSSASSDG